MTPQEIEALERTNYENSMKPPNPDHILGLLRICRDYPQVDVSTISLAYTEIFTDHRDILEFLTSPVECSMSPCDAIYEMLLESLELT